MYRSLRCVETGGTSLLLFPQACGSVPVSLLLHQRATYICQVYRM